MVLDSPNNGQSNYSCHRKRLYAAAPGRKCMCIKTFSTNVPGELRMNKGDIVESIVKNHRAFPSISLKY